MGRQGRVQGPEAHRQFGIGKSPPDLPGLAEGAFPSALVTIPRRAGMLKSMLVPVCSPRMKQRKTQGVRRDNSRREHSGRRSSGRRCSIPSSKEFVFSLRGELDADVQVACRRRSRLQLARLSDSLFVNSGDVRAILSNGMGVSPPRGPSAVFTARNTSAGRRVDENLGNTARTRDPERPLLKIALQKITE